ncbi:putative early E1 protein [Eptesicus serotinus papillomavirus 1]|uniref:Replication protein E1 n=1 Tax=Eptesicus serotinus papillomavirus 1 TaxID=1464071 RepID=W8EAA5_9PAPI|nr:putative early E1 protein [Eptesicus serotinus papillomavirus 1]AHJ81386.1 putative early E1 protein [Eptesicus serotinus papillomavirus 1]
MADSNEGTDDGGLEGCSGWYIVNEAECSEEDEDLEKLFDGSDSESNVSDLVDNASVEQGNTLELFQRQEIQTGLDQIQHLKRKFVNSPKESDVAALSPQLQKISITPKKVKKAKKNLFQPERITNEADDATEELQVSSFQDSGLQSMVHSTPFSMVTGRGAEAASIGEDNTLEGNNAGQKLNNLNEGVTGKDAVQLLMKTLNVKATILAKFKAAFGVSFSDLTRSFKSNKTMSKGWCLAIFGVREDHVEFAKGLLREHCEFLYLDSLHACALGLLELKNQKCRETVLKLLKTTMEVEDIQVLAEPPRTSSTVSALFWYRRCTDEDIAYGSLPTWILNQTSLQHRLGFEKPFNLSEMIQWAFDNDLTDEANIAYEYALLAEVEENAKAFLSHPSQAKIVRDVCTMVKHYKRAEMRNMTISEWIHQRCATMRDPDDEAWKNIANFLRFQGLQMFRFIGALQRFLKGEPKKSCLVFYGPPNTGKSLFAMSFIQFMKGKVITFANYNSQFWLSPLIDAKVALLDDATMKCWNYFDVFLRGALDGNTVCLDSKHRAPAQVKFPPMIVTTNVDVQKEDSLKYLYSRLQFFHFPEPLPICATGEPRYQLDEKSWHSFFRRFWVTIGLSDQEEEDVGAAKSLRLHTGSHT